MTAKTDDDKLKIDTKPSFRLKKAGLYNWHCYSYSMVSLNNHCYENIYSNYHLIKSS